MHKIWRRARRWLLPTLLIGVSLIVVAEVTARIWIGDAVLSPPLFRSLAASPYYTLEPGASSIVYQFGRDVRMTVSSVGLRTTEGARAVVGAKRVHLIGDSQTFGWGLSDEETIASRLQLKLGSKFLVENHGVPGYGPAEYSAILKQVPYEDWAVVISAEENDLWDAYGIYRNATSTCGYLTTPRLWGMTPPCWLMNSRLMQVTTTELDDLYHRTRPTPIGFQRQSQAAASVLAYRVSNLYGLEASSRRPQLLFAIVPWKPRFLPDELANYFPPPRQVEFARYFLDDCKVEEIFRKWPRPEQLYIEGDSHLSAIGADLIAHLLAQQILKQEPVQNR